MLLRSVEGTIESVINLREFMHWDSLGLSHRTAAIATLLGGNCVEG